jgi:deoxyribodipyrimidine photo-lyase
MPAISTPPISIFWFRQDLRLQDNPGLIKALEQGTCLLIYILDDTNAKDYNMGKASLAWLHHSLKSLNKDLNHKLNIYQGDPEKKLNQLVEKFKITSIFWNRCYEPWRVSRDQKIKESLTKLGIKVKSFNGSLLWEPWEISKKDGTHYKVFTPFYRKGCLQAAPPRNPLYISKYNLTNHLIKDTDSLNINALNLLSLKFDWADTMISHWQVGEEAALERLENFIDNQINDYKTGRDFPASEKVSKLSPHLHFGEISPHQVWHTALEKCEPSDDRDHFLSEIAWREFSYQLLFHYPTLPTQNLQRKFDRFPWALNEKHLMAWQQGQTGDPIIDAGMRELWQTGTMHNRVRMIVASFLVKNLLIHWHHGAAWFWDCLIDADLASNSASWQWVAGCGADAAPYFRIFNPVIQGQKFDPDGAYTKKYVPELKNLKPKYLFKPWEAPQNELKDTNIILGKTYPKPIINLKTSRELALNAFETIRTGVG